MDHYSTCNRMVQLSSSGVALSSPDGCAITYTAAGTAPAPKTYRGDPDQVVICSSTTCGSTLSYPYNCKSTYTCAANETDLMTTDSNIDKILKPFERMCNITLTAKVSPKYASSNNRTFMPNALLAPLFRGSDASLADIGNGSSRSLSDKSLKNPTNVITDDGIRTWAGAHSAYVPTRNARTSSQRLLLGLKLEDDDGESVSKYTPQDGGGCATSISSAKYHTMHNQTTPMDYPHKYTRNCESFVSSNDSSECMIEPIGASKSEHHLDEDSLLQNLPKLSCYDGGPNPVQDQFNLSKWGIVVHRPVVHNNIGRSPNRGGLRQPRKQTLPVKSIRREQRMLGNNMTNRRSRGYHSTSSYNNGNGSRRHIQHMNYFSSRSQPHNLFSASDGYIRSRDLNNDKKPYLYDDKRIISHEHGAESRHNKNHGIAGSSSHRPYQDVQGSSDRPDSMVNEQLNYDELQKQRNYGSKFRTSKKVGGTRTRNTSPIRLVLKSDRDPAEAAADTFPTDDDSISDSPQLENFISSPSQTRKSSSDVAENNAPSKNEHLQSAHIPSNLLEQEKVESGYHSQRSSPPNSVPVETSSGIASAVSTSTKNCTGGVQNGSTGTNPVEFEPSCGTDGVNEASDDGDMHGFHQASYITPLSNNGRYELSKMDVLSEEVWYYHQTITQTETVLNKKLHLRDMLYYSISPVFPMCGLYVVGSSLNGFGNNASDMDLCLMITNKDLDQRTDAVVVLNMIQSALADVKWVLDMHLILAKVPILRLKFVEPFHNITVDLNANNSVAIRNTHLLCYYSSFDWRVRPLVSVVKEWAKRKDINDANRSSFTSYSLVLMVIHYLQCGLTQPILPSLQAFYPKRFNPNADVRTLNVSMKLETPHGWKTNEVVTLGELLIGFLDYYAYKFDYLKDAISVRLGRKIPRTTVARQQLPYNGSIAQWNCICIEEPFTLSNTAHSMHNQVLFDAIREAFIESYRELNVNRDLKVFLDVKPIAVPTGTFNSSAQLSAMVHSDELTLSCNNSSAGRRKTKSLESSKTSDSSQATFVNANNHERDKATDKGGSIQNADAEFRENNKVIFRVSEEDEINNLQNAMGVNRGDCEVLARTIPASKSSEESLENHSPKPAAPNFETTPTGDDMTHGEKSCKSVLSERQPRGSSDCSTKSAEHQRCGQSAQKAMERHGKGLRRSRDLVTGNIGPKAMEVLVSASEAAGSVEVYYDSDATSS